MKEIQIENMSPIDIMHYLKSKWDTELIKRILNAWIFKIEDKEFTILSYPCIVIKNDKPRKDWFAFNHQVFWYCLMEFKDIKFAISELERILKWEKQYTFPNWTTVKLDK